MVSPELRMAWPFVREFCPLIPALAILFYE